METAPMASKSWTPSHGGEKAGTHHTDKTVEREGRDKGGETTSGQNPCA